MNADTLLRRLEEEGWHIRFVARKHGRFVATDDLRELVARCLTPEKSRKEPSPAQTRSPAD